MILDGALLAIVAGVLTWSFAEYAMHNWNGHLTKGRTAFSREHLAHHADANWFAPTWKKVAIAAPSVALVAVAAAALVGPLAGGLYAASFALTYAAYEVLHRRIHTHAPHNAYGRWMRRHHLLHHFKSPKMNHGVTSPIWDHLFGTHQPVTEPIRVPARHVMSWLVDPETGRVRDAFAEDYVLVKRRTLPSEDQPASADDLAAAYAGTAPAV